MLIGVRRTGSCSSLVLSMLLGSVVAITGCKSDGSTPVQSASSSSTVPPVTAPNQAPRISGAPGTSVTAGQTYTFVPVAADADGDPLGFSITNKPAWAQFDTATGRLTGTPVASNIGASANVQIAVSDGKTAATLPAFTLTVAAASIAATGAATLSWTAPTENTDGTALTNLAGYRIRYGTSADQLTQEIAINNAGTTTYMITSLTPAIYYFAIKAVTAAGQESTLSGVASKTII